SRNDRYCTSPNVRRIRNLLSAESSVPVPTLTTRTRQPAILANMVHLNSAHGWPHGPPQKSSICPPPEMINQSNLATVDLAIHQCSQSWRITHGRRSGSSARAMYLIGDMNTRHIHPADSTTLPFSFSMRLVGPFPSSRQPAESM